MTKDSPSKNKSSNRVDKGLHPNNLHNYGYDFPALIKSLPGLNDHVKTNKYERESINFSDPVAVKTLNSALLNHHYGIKSWDIPKGFLCPPIPGRVDYIHYIAELINTSRSGKNTQLSRTSTKLLDIGTGANGIYSLLACKVYNWHCTATDIDPVSLANVANIVSKNPSLHNRLQLRRKNDKSHVFEGIIQPGEFFDVSVCNPPFHASLKEALAGSQRKLNNLAINRNETVINKALINKALINKAMSKQTRGVSSTLNFGGQKAELWCKGGESKFLRIMIKESKVFGGQCRWFTSLISKNENVKPAKKHLRKLAATDIKEIEMKQGNKITRILAWTFLSD